jgi:hypothetical protein
MGGLIERLVIPDGLGGMEVIVMQCDLGKTWKIDQLAKHKK